MTEPSRPDPSERTWRTATFGQRLRAVLLAPLMAAGLLWLTARAFHLPWNRVFYSGIGVAIILLTLIRPWWYWDHPRAHWLRDTIGDDATTLFYLLVGGMALWVGCFTNLPVGRR